MLGPCSSLLPTTTQCCLCADLWTAWLHSLHLWAHSIPSWRICGETMSSPHPFQKPYQEFTPHQQATQYFDRLRDIREEAIHFESAQRKVSFHDAIPRYKWEEAFLNYGRGWRLGILSEEDRTTTVSIGSAPEATTGQFTDVHQENFWNSPSCYYHAIHQRHATTWRWLSLLRVSSPPDPDTYEPTGNKFTRSHRTEEDNSNDPHASSQGDPWLLSAGQQEADQGG